MALWVWAALLGALAQTGRNATQAGLTSALGTVGATQVRFLFGLPFALLFLAIQITWTGSPLPIPGPATLGWTALGAWAQIAGTALMLLLMKDQSFGVATAWLKTEPVLVALLGITLLGDHLTPGTLVAIAIATAGVLILSIKPGPLRTLFQTRPAALGLMAGLGYGLAAIGFRGGITALPDGSFLTRALTTLTLALAIQTATLLLWLMLFDRPALRGSFRVWRSSLAAGFLGAFASACWFTGFSLTSAANVRTLALVEIPMAQLVARLHFRQKTTLRQYLGMTTILLGVAALLWQQG
ncbi:multidrug DMT transporter permease [Tabrizicola sp. TH137]|uniref:DMT family transporter n=1 Tax=Tabrizicola sp. TH137 TaxID=2067452 RepID=UPI000C7DD5C3|nr:DMT family transporter [Tabrizicola sp. TH137]PLL14271.1 multidrug DMT transporter permease [Tabrizicola sp. TH137]